ncbi:hypothetical protein GHYDROH2_01000 [Geobacter hydrogenophilus]|uniref:Uncharacterized protein n=1 Tax=Geobacter hydrogenophilus TaxID=40983 RepID=A0A9W6LAZ6_9BACT|nr:hypothetical protein GHYDROH2_01000 [Geobacter hydrogenophilus]
MLNNLIKGHVIEKILLIQRAIEISDMHLVAEFFNDSLDVFIQFNAISVATT